MNAIGQPSAGLGPDCKSRLDRLSGQRAVESVTSSPTDDVRVDMMPRWNRTAIPWGLVASGSFSAAVGIPDVSENRTLKGWTAGWRGEHGSASPPQGGSKCARTHHAPSVNRPETRMNSPSVLIEDLKDVGNKLGRHDSNLLMHEGDDSVSFAGQRVISGPWSERLETALCRSSSGRMLRRPAPVDRFHSSTALPAAEG